MVSPFTQREREALDRHITGNYGEDQLKGEGMKDTSGAVVLHSGGQDSTTCLAWALKRWDPADVYPLIIDYQQRHAIEIACAARICSTFGTQPPRVLHLGVLRELGGAALTDDTVGVDLDAKGTGNVYAEMHDLPSTFVPGRNMLFFTLATAYGARLGVHNIVTGVCQEDRAGYPDCREEFVAAAADALSLALAEDSIEIYAPLLHRDKSETFKLAEELDVLDVVIKLTSTCYNGVRDDLHEWGYGCGKCPACIERANGFERYKKELTHA